MQIRLTVLAPGRACDVLVTAPAGTALAAVASGLATAVLGPDTPGTTVMYAGRERLDAQRAALGAPPLVDGAVLSLGAPGEDEAPVHEAAAQLRVVAGPDAGGVHLLHGGRVVIGRSADADVPLDDPDVSRLHCAVTVAPDGAVAVADLGSTNGTMLEGAPVGPAPVPLPRGASLRLGESTLRLAPGTREPARATAPDGEGHLRLTPAPSVREADGEARQRSDGRDADTAGAARGPAGGGPFAGSAGYADSPGGPGGRAGHLGGGTQADGAGSDGRGGVPRARGAEGAGDPRAGLAGPGSPAARGPAGPQPGVPYVPGPRGGEDPAGYGPQGGEDAVAHDWAPGVEDDEAQAHPGRRRGLGAWARRLGGTRGETHIGVPVQRAGEPAGERPTSDGVWPDAAELLLTALGPGRRLWERGPDHPEALVVRLGTADRPERPVPVTAGLKEVGSLGLAGPRARLTGLARSVVAQLAALHAPSELEIVLVTTDRALSVEERRRDWGWLGWLPHTRPGHGQDCRLLLAFDRDQAAARTAELTRRLDEGPLGAGWASAEPSVLDEVARRHTGPRTLLIVDGDPGSAALRESTARLAEAGPAAGVHVLCLAETPAASAVSSVTATYDMACLASLPFRECGAVALLSGDVAGALRLLRTAPGQRVGEGRGTVAVVDAVSAAWAERFGRALAPLRTTGPATGPRPPTALPRTARLLDELGLARATPASLLARWAQAADSPEEACVAVLGAGPRGPVAADLGREGPHLLIEGPPGSGRTEMLRAVAASLAAGARPDRLGLLLVDGAGGMRGEGLAALGELPHVTEHLIASDPVRMREFAQALGAELKRRAELLGPLTFAQWHERYRATDAAADGPAGQPGGRPGDVPASATRTIRLRPGPSAGRQEPVPVSSPLPRLAVLVDDFDALVAPALGSPGRPAAGSVVRALEAIARDGERLGVHLVAASAAPERTAGTELARTVRLRAVLNAPPVAPAPEDPAPGRGHLAGADGYGTPFQAGRVTGRIPRTATQRPTVAALEWERMGDPPARRPVRELGNGPTDLALLASAMDRAARSVAAAPVAPLTPAHP
ncbi:FHA domain-containing protein [Streptomyces sp. NBC_01497]|uniref:FHA domain-containing protein n=1 Tax=Streptomyces sp. NBC_01497 TaxID=2903885 RepID=UPI002E349191|nr:FHA domain-containing protein [Streptomyces sp. NBC_01497]